MACLLVSSFIFFFFTATATTAIYTLSLHDALPIFQAPIPSRFAWTPTSFSPSQLFRRPTSLCRRSRSEEHTSELQSRQYLVCRLLLEKKKTKSDFVNSPQLQLAKLKRDGATVRPMC